MQWLMLQQEKPDDFVIATGMQYSVRQFVEFAAAELGVTLAFEGEGESEIGTVLRVDRDNTEFKPGDTIVRVDPRYYRPTEVETLLGDPTKAREKLGWTPRISLPELIHEMVTADYAEARRDALVKSAGFQTFNHHEYSPKTESKHAHHWPTERAPDHLLGFRQPFTRRHPLQRRNSSLHNRPIDPHSQRRIPLQDT